MNKMKKKMTGFEMILMFTQGYARVECPGMHLSNCCDTHKARWKKMKN